MILKRQGDIQLHNFALRQDSSAKTALTAEFFIGSSSSHARIPLHKKPLRVRTGGRIGKGPQLRIIRSKLGRHIQIGKKSSENNSTAAPAI